ncbi:MAG: PAS domain S-box protein [Magnetococcus sp. DMHC-6]
MPPFIKISDLGNSAKFMLHISRKKIFFVLFFLIANHIPLMAWSSPLSEKSNVFLSLFIPFILGLILGGIGIRWINHRSFQREHDQQQRIITSLEQTVELLQSLLTNNLDAIIITDSQGQILDFNPAAEKLLGPKKAEMLGQQLASTLFPEKFRQCYLPNSNLFQKNIENYLLYKIVDLFPTLIDDSSLQVELSTIQLQTKGELFFAFTLRDSTQRNQLLKSMEEAFSSLEMAHIKLKQEVLERTKLEETLAKRERLYHSIIQFTSEGFWLFSPISGKILEVNEALCQMLGRKRQEIIDSSPDQFIHPNAKKEMARILKSIPFTLQRHFNTIFLTPDGQQVYVQVSCTTLTGADDQEASAFAFITDITESIRSKQALQESEKRFRSITESAPEAILSTNQEGIILSWNPGAETIFGYSETESIGQNVSLLIPPRFIQKHRVGMQHIQHSHNKTFWLPGHPLEVTGLRKDGVEIPMEISLGAWQSGQDHLFSVIARDISARRQLEKKNDRTYIFRIAISALLETGLEPLTLDRQLEVALQILLTVPQLSVQAKGAIFLWEETKQSLTLAIQQGVSDTWIAQHNNIMIGEGFYGNVLQKNEILYDNHSDPEGHFNMGDFGQYGVPIFSRGTPLALLILFILPDHHRDLDEEAFLTTVATTLASLIEGRRIEERVLHLAHHDSLTGLPNRTTFEDRLILELARCRRNKQPLTVMFLDLDRFKKVNDTYGHEIGDLLLVEVAQRIRSCLREMDTVARLGGDEFTIILSSVSRKEDAGGVAKKIIHLLTTPFILQEKLIEIGVSIGISRYPKNGDTMETLIQRADQAMYAVKRSGRNNFQFFDGVES